MKKALIVAAVLAALGFFSSVPAVAGPATDCAFYQVNCDSDHYSYGRSYPYLGNDYASLLANIGQVVGSVIDSQRKIKYTECYQETDSQGKNYRVCRTHTYSSR